jgi:hypothetical protein
MWTDKEMNEYALVLDLQEQAVIKALELGYKDLIDVKTFVESAVIADIDYNYIESIHTLAMNPDRKVSLVD